MDWNLSFGAFRLLGTQVRIHWSLPVFFIFYLLRAQSYQASPSFIALFVVLPMLLLFASVLMHEYGHVLAARSFGISTSAIVLTPIGGYVPIAQATSPTTERRVAAAGPAVNAVLALVATCLYLALGGPMTLDVLIPFAKGEVFGELWMQGQIAPLLAYDFAQTNAMLFWFNMLVVAYPMDGGRVLLSFLWERKGFHAGLRLSCRVAQVVAGLLMIAAVLTANPFLGVIAFFVFMQATMTLRQLHLMPDPGPAFPWRGPAPARPSRPNALRRWLIQRRERRVRALLARAEVHGLGSLSQSERRFLNKVRSERRPQE